MMGEYYIKTCGCFQNRLRVFSWENKISDASLLASTGEGTTHTRIQRNKINYSMNKEKNVIYFSLFSSVVLLK